MSYGLVYTLPFSSIDGRAYEVRIEREGYIGESKELKGQTSPFTVTIDSEEFIYTPTRFSTATLAIFGGDYLQDLFSTDYRMHRVTLYADGVAVWCGFIKPEMYTQDYSSIKFNLEVNCYSAMSVLEFVEYKQSDEERGFVSLWSLLKKCIEESKGQYSAVYLPHVYGLSQSDYNSWNNPLESMMVSEQNFFDEDDNAMSLLEVLKEIMKLMNWTCADWRGELYFIDVDNEIGEYYRYTADLASYTKVQADEMNVQEIGFAGSDHTLDILGGFNKASVRCSNYPVGDALPDMELNEADWVTTKDEKYYQSVTKGYRVERYKVYRPINTKYELNAYKMGDTTDSVTLLSRDEEKEYIDNSGTYMPGKLTGAIAWKYAEFNLDAEGNADATDLDYTEEINIKTRRDTSTHVAVFSANNTIPIIRVKGVPAAYQDGAFNINFNAVLNGVIGNTINTWDFHFQLRIGNKYYHGNGSNYIWDENPATNEAYPNNLNVQLDEAAHQGEYTGEYPVVSNRKMDDGLEGVEGYICHLPDGEVLFGDMEFVIYAPAITTNIGGNYFASIGLRNFSFGYNDYSYNNESGDSDRIYENIVNENYINELDEIEFKISSYNDDGACYSKVTIGDGYLTNNLYTGITGENIRPEEFLIRRIVDHYSAPKIKLTQVITKADIKPYTVLSDNYSVNRKYINAGGEIDYRKNRFSCIMIEIEDEAS
ncbi:hypothetical protein [uncultured Bacteroides sp.]|uniref:hypothetical protein n=1 Tax=uncultured Bacteroides sp. TaxID=162156 RepID=UPI00259AA0F2|nr:hypothetical protein [uncultured Bacteroides sp.]